MAPQKRKYHDTGPESPVPHIPTRRSTRQHPDTSAGTEPANYQLRSGRVRAAAIGDSPGSEAKRPTSRGKDGDALKSAIADLNLAPATRQTRTTRHKITVGPPEVDDTAATKATRPPSPPGNRRRRIAQPKQSQNRTRHDSHSPPRQKLRSSSPSQHPERPLPAAIGSGPAPPADTASITPNRTPPSILRSDRNIDKVVFGNACFKAWYPSYYGKEFLGDVSANAGAANAKIGGGKRGSPMLDRLYICPCCFKYSKDMAPWWQHVRCCERKRFVPGTKVYTHPRHSKTVRMPRPNSASTTLAELGDGLENSRGDDTGQSSDDGTLNSGEWSVWEVDGDNEGLFCQNLSLFAKLFLDNKSVFFDVTGFNYFLLVYTPSLCESQTAPSAQADSLAKSENPASAAPNSQFPPSTPFLPYPRPQIVGFFSKEKMSWDNNNLACILVFPPWQRKGLGALLMGVSYEISRREGILGGPEKPISELGRKGYKRFWAGEVARWILELDLPASSPESAHAARVTRRETEKEKERGRDRTREQEEFVVDVEQCSRDTWIVPDDCLAVLRDMGVVEDAGPGPPKRNEADGTTDVNMQGKEKEEKEGGVPLVQRVRIDKAAVRAWARQNKIELTRACDPRGFVEGYAIKQVEDHDGEG
ncbi:acyl-CoA N-acyltransferase [Xylaria intraflava]|nr:acyl-CoA N-acyltransferase [Xylaria intraflava]